eukprot:1119809-Pelagomonas_calceolata.AAC.2
MEMWRSRKAREDVSKQEKSIGNNCSLQRCTAAFASLQEKNLRDGREVCVYSISCKRQSNIDITLDWLSRHAKS